MAKTLLNKNSLLKQARHDRRRLWWRRLGITLAVVAVLLVGMIAALYHPALRITKYEITGSQVVRNQEIESVVNAYFTQKIWLVIPRDNILFYNKLGLESEVKRLIPRLEGLSIDISDLNTLNFQLQESRPLALWCGINLETDSCYFLDSSGRIFAKAPAFSPGVFTVFRGELSTDPMNTAPVGKDFIRMFNFAELLKPVLLRSSINGRVDYISQKEQGDFAVTVQTPENNSWEILVGQEGDAQDLAENLGVILATTGFQKEWQSRPSQLRYIDLRFGKKVYYKFE